MSTIIHSTWFTNSQGTIGIVRVHTEHDGIKYYIGRSIMEREEDDAQYIAEFGSSFPTKAGDALFGISSSKIQIGYINKDVEGAMPWTKLNSDAAKVSLGKHPIYLGEG